MPGIGDGTPNPLRLMVEKTSLQGESKQVGSRERGIPNVPNVPNVIQMVCRADAVDTGNVKYVVCHTPIAFQLTNMSGLRLINLRSQSVDSP